MMRAESCLVFLSRVHLCPRLASSVLILPSVLILLRDPCVFDVSRCGGRGLQIGKVKQLCKRLFDLDVDLQILYFEVM